MANTKSRRSLDCLVVLIATATILTTVSFGQKNVSKDICFDEQDEGGVNISSTFSLSLKFYEQTCPEAEDLIFTGVERAVRADRRMAASLVRMHFHDCFVTGCDASLLLDDTLECRGEKSAAPNLNSLRGFEVVDGIKSELESLCPETVSCADIITAAARDSIVLSSGPRWEVEMGRKDSLKASKDAADRGIPSPSSDVAGLLRMFHNVGLSQKDMVALSGAHTIGNARCIFSTEANEQCPSGMNNSATLAQLDQVTPLTFDSFYFKNLLSGDGFLHSDQALVSDKDSTAAGLVQTYAQDTEAFFEDFKESMLRMGRLGSNADGEIRRSCRVVN